MSMRSRYGCTICRGRKVKCDEVKPTCGPCAKSLRQCAYSDSSLFRSFDAKLGSKLRFVTGQSTPADNHTWLDIPTELTFINIVNPSEQEEPHQLAKPSPSVLFLHTSADSAENSFFEVQRSPSSSEPIELHENIDGDSKAAALDVYLLRAFKDGPGQWLDLFNTTAFFSCRVPIMALKSEKSILKASVCALSAKFLYRTQAREASFSTTPSSASLLPERPWYLHHVGIGPEYKHVKYYDDAITRLKEVIFTDDFESHLTGECGHSEEILISILILCMYELMDAPGAEWKAHLGALHLLKPSFSMSLEQSVCSQTLHDCFKSTIFWNFARQDFLSAFISETQTRLDLDDIWTYTSPPLDTNYNGQSLSILCRDSIEEITKSNELAVLVGKLVNYITCGDSLNPADFKRPAGQRLEIGLTQEKVLEKWQLISHDFQRWLSSLPSSFSAFTKIQNPGCTYGSSQSRPSTLDEIWYAVPLCAATMQSYHMASIILLTNKPMESTAIRSTVTARLGSYRQIQKEALQHGRDICGISLANAPAAVRIHSVQPLFVAGQCLEAVEERQIVVKLLSEIEVDLGWSTGYLIDKLNTEWAQHTVDPHYDIDGSF